MQNNYTSLIHGHAFPPLVEAMQQQLTKGTIFASPLEQQIQLSEMICNRIPSIELLRYTNSGTEATMHAVRAARAFTGKTKVVKLEGGYHGTSDIFEASVDPDILKAGDISRPQAVPDSEVVPKQAMEQVLVAPFNRMDITKRIIEENKDDIAAFIVEPIQGSAGQIEPEKGYLEFVRTITKQYGIVLIFDEIVTFRISAGGAQEYYGVIPDMTTLGKLIGGGLPIGVFGGKKEIDKINYLGDLLRKKLKIAAHDVGLNILINGVASLTNIIFSNNKITEYRGLANSHEEFNELLSLGLLNRGVFIAPRGMLSISTPMTKEDVETCVSAVKECFLQLKPTIEETAPKLVL